MLCQGRRRDKMNQVVEGGKKGWLLTDVWSGWSLATQSWWSLASRPTHVAQGNLKVASVAVQAREFFACSIRKPAPL